jgi:hypothetical protein
MIMPRRAPGGASVWKHVENTEPTRLWVQSQRLARSAVFFTLLHAFVNAVFQSATPTVVQKIAKVLTGVRTPMGSTSMDHSSPHGCNSAVRAGAGSLAADARCFT